MKVGIVSVDSLIPNVALMKLSAFHKRKGDEVSIYNPLTDKPNVIYASKIFKFTDDYAYFPNDCDIVRGGTAYDSMVKLPQEAENAYPDYELFSCDYAIGRITRGCPRNCNWCVVSSMDGHQVKQVATLDDFWNGQKRVRLLDDNLTANRSIFIETCNRLATEKVEVKFDALDIRFIDIDAAKALSKVKRWGQVHFAFDTVSVEKYVRSGVSALKDGGFPLRNATFYVLIGFNTTPEEDMYRVQLLNTLGVETFVMPFNKSDHYQKAFARWCNHKAIFRTCTFDEYQHKAKKQKQDIQPLFAV